MSDTTKNLVLIPVLMPGALIRVLIEYQPQAILDDEDIKGTCVSVLISAAAQYNESIKKVSEDPVSSITKFFNHSKGGEN